MSVTQHITATTTGGQIYTVNLKRNFVLDTGRSTLVCTSCGWTDSPLSLRKTYLEFAGEHLASAHDADLGLRHSKSASYRQLQLLALPLAALVVIIGWMYFR